MPWALLLRLIPVATQLIQAVEELFPHGEGATKHDVVAGGLLGSIAPLIPGAANDPVMLDAINSIIKGIVALLNASQAHATAIPVSDPVDASTVLVPKPFVKPGIGH